MHHQPTEIITLVFSILLLCMILCLAFEEKIHAKKSVITGTFAVFCVLFADIFGILPIGDIHNVFGESIHIPTFITAIDWEVISIIVGTSLFVDVTSKSGLFSWIALKVTKLSKGDPQKLLYYYSVLTVLFSALLSNVTAMVIIGSLTAVSLQKLKRIELLLGFLLIEGFLTNVGGLLTLISSVPNIIIGNLAGISFVEFFIKAAPLVTVASIGSVLLGSKLFGITSIKDERGKEEALKLALSSDKPTSRIAASWVYSQILYIPVINEYALGLTQNNSHSSLRAEIFYKRSRLCPLCA